MSLNRLAEEYMESSRKCRERYYELLPGLKDEELPETDRYILRRKLTVLWDMYRETAAISRYLSNYYRRGEQP